MAILVFVAYPLASRHANNHGWSGAWLTTLLPVFVHGALFVLFTATLRPGRTPMISRFAQLEQGELSVELCTYTRRLTIIWCVFFAAMSVLALWLALWASVEVWFLHTSVTSYLLIAILFFGEYLYRRWRYPHYSHASPWQLFRNIRRHGLR